MVYKRVTIPLSKAEDEVLQIAASKACRRPRDQARFILLSSLGLIADVDAVELAPDQQAKEAGHA